MLSIRMAYQPDFVAASLLQAQIDPLEGKLPEEQDMTGEPPLSTVPTQRQVALALLVKSTQQTNHGK
jgi:hypothetical protein